MKNEFMPYEFTNWTVSSTKLAGNGNLYNLMIHSSFKDCMLYGSGKVIKIEYPIHMGLYTKGKLVGMFNDSY